MCDLTGWISELPAEKFSDETIEALINLGNALLAVYNRLAVKKGESVSGRVFVLKPRKQLPDEEHRAM